MFNWFFKRLFSGQYAKMTEQARRVNREAKHIMQQTTKAKLRADAVAEAALQYAFVMAQAVPERRQVLLQQLYDLSADREIMVQLTAQERRLYQAVLSGFQLERLKGEDLPLFQDYCPDELERILEDVSFGQNYQPFAAKYRMKPV